MKEESKIIVSYLRGENPLAFPMRLDLVKMLIQLNTHNFLNLTLKVKELTDKNVKSFKINSLCNGKTTT